MRTKTTNVLFLVFAAFALLGASNGLLGVAWPSIQTSFRLYIDDVGVLLIAGTIGYTLTSLITGQLLTRLGYASLLAAAALTLTLGLIGEAVSPAWWTLVVAGFFVGAGNGVIDAGLNTFMAERHGASMMSWMHGLFGIGTAASPLMMTALTAGNISWRVGYLIVAAAQTLVLVGIVLTRHSWDVRGREIVAAQRDLEAATPVESLRQASTWAYILVFFFYGGVEISTGQWAYSLFTQARGAPLVEAGIWVSVYWWSFTIDRMAMGFVGDRVKPWQIIRVGSLGCLAGVLLFWWNPVNLVGFLGLAMIGLFESPVFPFLMTNTPNYLGPRHTPNAIGFQVAAVSVSAGILPALAGIFARYWGLETLGPFLLANAVLMVAIHEWTLKTQRAALKSGQI